MADNPFADVVGGLTGVRDFLFPAQATRREAVEQRPELAEIAAGPGFASVALQRELADRQQRALMDAQSTWNSMLSHEMGGTTGAPTPEAAQRALRRFVLSPQYFALGQQGQSIAQTMQQVIAPPPSQAFTLGPNQRRFEGTDPATGLPRQVAEGPLQPPTPPPGPADQLRSQELRTWLDQGRNAQTELNMLNQLGDVLGQPGVSGQRVLEGVNVLMRRFNLSPVTSEAQLVQALTQRLIPALHRESGGHAMTNEDRAMYTSAFGGIGTNADTNRAIIGDLIRRARERAGRYDLAIGAVQAGTGEAMTSALAEGTNPEAMSRRFRTAEQRWVSQTTGIPADQLNPRSIPALAELVQRLGTQSPRLQRFVQMLRDEINADHR